MIKTNVMIVGGWLVIIAENAVVVADKPFLCLNPICGKLAEKEGFCSICFRIGSFWVRSGKTTWDTLRKQALEDSQKLKTETPEASSD